MGFFDAYTQFTKHDNTNRHSTMNVTFLMKIDDV